VADYLDALAWVRSLGGVEACIDRSRSNLEVIENFVAGHEWIRFLASNPAIRSCTSVCLVVDLPDESVKRMAGLFEQEGVAFDIGAYRDAPAGLRIWCGSTVESRDVELLMPWLEWAYGQVRE
jgi:phosphoserine aminotransferase